MIMLIDKQRTVYPSMNNQGATFISYNNILHTCDLSRVKIGILLRGNRDRFFYTTSKKDIDYDYEHEHEHEKTSNSLIKICL